VRWRLTCSHRRREAQSDDNACPTAPQRRLSDACRRCYNPFVTEFRILGPLEVVNETGPVALTGQKQRALLALLLIHPGETLSTDRIVD